MIPRYSDGERINHWLVALLFVLAGLSGLAFFHPALFFFSHLFGGGTWARILHPFLGLLMVLAFVGLFVRLRRDNRFDARDREWLRQAPHLVRCGDASHMPPVGKYNAGQKLVFWSMALCLLLLLVTGFLFWQPWFAGFFPIVLRRVAVLLHAVAAVVLILTAIVHIYAGLWIKGSVRAMVRGEVTEGWAREHHPLWYRQIRRR